MVFDERLSPARVSAAAAAKLPRAVLLALIVAYIVSGLFGRDPWPDDDAAGFGIMWSMARSGDWLLPAVAGEPVAVPGLLAYWTGAASIALLGPLIGAAAAARLPAIAWFILATAALWYAALRLARREEAQPVAFAFGGEATSRDYGRMLADIAVLLVLGTVGPLVTLHETTQEPAAFALCCVTLFALALSLERAMLGAALAGAAIGLLVLTRGLQPAVWLAVVALLVVGATDSGPRRMRAAGLVLVVAGAIVTAWMAALVGAHGEAGRGYLQGWLDTGLATFALPTAGGLAWLLRSLAWYSWPLWPLALWALYAWRHGIGRPHIALGLALVAALAASLATAPSTRTDDLVHIVAPMALLAAFGAISLRRATENAIDWFAITAYGLVALAVWAYFFAMHAGVPPKMNVSVMRLTAGYVPPLDWARVIVAAAASGFWLALVVWRARQPTGALWRGPALGAAGLVMLWVVFSSLFLSAVDHRRSFAPLARAVAAQIAQAGQPNDCVVAHHLRASHRALFAFHGGLRFAADGAAGCAFALHRDVAGSLLDDNPPPGQWTELWQGHRPGLGQELFRLYRRSGD